MKRVVYDTRLIPLDFDSIIRNSKCVVIVTGFSCGGCVEYFAKEKIATTFIYFLNDLSLMEMNRVRFQVDAPKLRFYYALRNPMTEALFAEKSPQMATITVDTMRIIDYNELSRLTHDFTLKGKQARKSIGIK